VAGLARAVLAFLSSMRFVFLLALFGLLAPVTTRGAPDLDPSNYRSEEALNRYARGRLLEEQGNRARALEEYYRALFLDPRAIEVARRVSEVAAHMGDPGRSLEFAERALALDSEDPRSLWLKGAALLNLGRDQEALGPLERAVGHDSSRAEYFRTLGHVAERLDRYDLLARCYRRLVWLDDGDGEAWFQLAAAEARQGRFGAADTAMAMAVDLNPLRPGVFFLRGWIAEALGRSDEARQDYLRHLEIHRDDQSARRRLAVLLARQGKFREALDQARTLAKARPDDLEMRHLEADLTFQSGDAADGARLVDRIRDDYPDDWEALTVRVGLLARHGKGRQAVAEADRWLEAHPEEPRARLLAAQARESSGDLEGAIQQLELAVKAMPDSLAPRALLARAYERDGRHRDAEPVWAEANRRFPLVTPVAFDLALCREKLGDLAGAEAAVRDVLAREPDNPTALNFLGYLFADHNRNLEEAVELIRRALAADPDNGAFMDSLGWAFYRMGRLDEARTSLERAVVLSGGDPVIHEHLGDVYKDLQLNDLAREQYRKSLAFDQTNERVKTKLSSLR
jgi:tetratricopeptide (TPR) repeat protein